MAFGGRLQRRRIPILCFQYGRSIFTGTTATDVTDVTEKRGLQPRWFPAPFGLTMKRRQARSFVWPVCRFPTNGKTILRDENTRERYYCIPRVYDPMPSWCFITTCWHIPYVFANRALAEFGKSWGLSQLMSQPMVDGLVRRNDTVSISFCKPEWQFDEVGLSADIATVSRVWPAQAWVSIPLTYDQTVAGSVLAM